MARIKLATTVTGGTRIQSGDRQDLAPDSCSVFEVQDVKVVGVLIFGM